MTFKELTKIVVKNRFWILTFTSSLLLVSIWITGGKKKIYYSHTLLNTGLISGYNIESQKGSRVDYAYTNNELENLINLASATETLKELALRILAESMIALSENQLQVLENNAEEIILTISKIEININDFNSKESLYEELKSIYSKNTKNSVYELIHSKDPYFSLKKMGDILIKREGNSDMIRMEFQSQDPYLCQKTLRLLTDIFLQKHKSIKEGQTESVIDFFETATNKSLVRLNEAEERLLNFSVSNKIINYYEQTRFISGNKEELDKKYQEELKSLAASDSALSKIETEIDDFNDLPELYASLISSRKTLSGLTSEITLLDLSSSKEGSSKLDSLNSEKSNIENSLFHKANMIIQKSSTPEGINRKNLLEKWLNEHINRAEAKAKLKVLDKVKLDYDKLYDRFAPLGSTLKKLEREIDVAEREYLENLHSFNQAKLHKYNMLMSSNLKVIDPAFLPANAEASKRLLLIALAGVLGMVLSIAFLIATELLDNSIKTPHNAQALSGLNVVGSLPLRKNPSEENKVNYEMIEEIALNLFFQKISSLFPDFNQSKTVNLISHNPGEGKTYLKEKLKEYSNRRKIKCSFDNLELEDGVQFKFQETPSFLQNNFPLENLKSADVNILVCNANRNWSESDRQALEILKKSTSGVLMIMLNGVLLEDMESVIGEIPKKRSAIRKVIKSILFSNPKTAIA